MRIVYRSRGPEGSVGIKRNGRYHNSLRTMQWGANHFIVKIKSSAGMYSWVMEKGYYRGYMTNMYLFLNTAS